VPNYDGREPEPTSAGEVLIWVPRALFYPLYLVTEYVIRAPIGWAVSSAEEADLPGLLMDFFTFGPEKKAGIIPTALIDFGFRPSVGVYIFWDDYVADDQDLRFRGAYGGNNWVLVNLAHRSNLSDDTMAEARFEYSHRPDWLFYGMGPSSREDHEARYTAQHIEGGLRFESRFWRASTMHGAVGIRDVSFGTEGCCSDVDIASRVGEGAYGYPEGFEEGYTAVHAGGQVALDTRRLRHLSQDVEGSDFVSPPGSGLRLGLRGQLGSDLRKSADGGAGRAKHSEWIRYGGTLGGYLDLTGHQRVLGLSGIVDFADPLAGNGRIPFTEQSALGGDGPMRGFLEGRLIGRSSVVWRLEYRWPVWVWLDGVAHYSVGNVFGKHLEDFSAGLLRQSFGTGFRATSSRDHTFELLLAFGSQTFDDGGDVEAVRFVLGASSGF